MATSGGHDGQQARGTHHRGPASAGRPAPVGDDGLLSGGGGPPQPAAETTRRIGAASIQLESGQSAVVTLLENGGDAAAHWERVMIESTREDHSAFVEAGVMAPDGTVIDAVGGNLQHYPFRFDAGHTVPPQHTVDMYVRNFGESTHSYKLAAVANTDVPAEPGDRNPGILVGMVGSAVASGIAASVVSRLLR